jgi:aerotaxis receptor
MHSVSSKPRDQLDEDEYLITRNDAQGKITYVNGRWEHVTGYDLSTLLGASTKILYHRDMPDEVGADVWATLSRRRTWTGLQKLRRADGSPFWALATVTPDLRNNTVVGFISIRTRADPAQVSVADAVYRQWKAGQGGRFKIREGAIFSRGSFRWISSRLGHAVSSALVIGSSGFVAGASAALLEHLIVPDLPRATTVATSVLGAATGVVTALLRDRRRAAEEAATALDTIRLLSGGDLSRSAADSDGRSNGSLGHGLDVMRRGFVIAVREMRASTSVTRHAAGEIASATAHLAQRATQQAASLEKTAVAIEQLNQSVHSNSDSTDLAYQRMKSASAFAVRGVESTQRAGAAMRSVTERAQRIAGISSMIESIAFQTSILALNASVEAARAGTDGRGFAVVASEVRALAQRSSSAAGEIRNLVEDTVTQIDLGARYVVANEQTIKELERAIRELETIVASIADATRQQSIAIDEVGKNISELSDSVVRTASMVSQAATAAEGLTAQSGALEVSMEAFRLASTDR